jgi:hypothetical protein
MSTIMTLRTPNGDHSKCSPMLPLVHTWSLSPPCSREEAELLLYQGLDKSIGGHLLSGVGSGMSPVWVVSGQVQFL